MAWQTLLIIKKRSTELVRKSFRSILGDNVVILIAFFRLHLYSDIDCRRTDRTQLYFALPPDPSPNDDIELRDEESNMPPTNRHVNYLGKILMTYNVWEKDLGRCFVARSGIFPYHKS